MNFGTVYKQTFKSTFSQVSTSILLVIFAILMAVLWLLVPALVMKDHSSQSFIVDFIKQFMFQMFYVCTMVSTIFIVVISTNANELAEMTFTISRPVSRRVYLSAKALCVSTIVALMFIYMIGMYIGYDVIVKHYDPSHVSPFHSKNISWATAIVPLLLSYVYAIYLPFVLRTFFSDKIISIFVVITALLAYQIYIIACAIASGGRTNPLYGSLIIPACVYGVGSVAAVFFSYYSVNKVNIKV